MTLAVAALVSILKGGSIFRVYDWQEIASSKLRPVCHCGGVSLLKEQSLEALDFVFGLSPGLRFLLLLVFGPQPCFNFLGQALLCLKLTGFRFEPSGLFLVLRRPLRFSRWP